MRHLYICDFHKNFIQSVRNKRKRKTSDDGGESPDHDVEVPEVKWAGTCCPPVWWTIPLTLSLAFVALGGPFPASGQHVETLQATLQAADQAWTEQGPAGRGEHAQQSTDRSLIEFGEAKILCSTSETFWGPASHTFTLGYMTTFYNGGILSLVEGPLLLYTWCRSLCPGSSTRWCCLLKVLIQCSKGNNTDLKHLPTVLYYLTLKPLMGHSLDWVLGYMSTPPVTLMVNKWLWNLNGWKEHWRLLSGLSLGVPLMATHILPQV